MNIDIEKLRQVMHDLAARRGNFNLFGLFLRADSPDKWDLVVSSPWLERGKLKALGEFTKKLSSVVGQDQVLSLSRIVTLDSDDPALTAVTKAVNIDDGTVEIKDSDFFGLKIKHAYILRAKRPQPSPVGVT
jgi:hypothetical protein